MDGKQPKPVDRGEDKSMTEMKNEYVNMEIENLKEEVNIYNLDQEEEIEKIQEQVK